MTSCDGARNETGAWRQGRPGPRLTKREVQCLTWAAHGKSSWETAKICEISESTVNFHLKNAQRKLGAANKCHALAKALMGGFIEL